jgi:hypothetical protein
VACAELEYLVQSGSTPFEAIEAGTGYADEAMGGILDKPAASYAQNLLERFYLLLLVSSGILFVIRRLA